MKRFVAVFLLAGGLLLAGGANAVPVTWSINMTFTSNDTVVGSFVYDADTNTYSNISVVYTESGTPFTLSACSATCNNNRFVFATAVGNGNPAIDFALSGGQLLTNAGGTINSAAGAFGGSCFGANCGFVITNNNNTNQPFALTGVVNPAPTAKAIPSLSEWTQLLLALMVLTMIGWHFHRERSY